MKKDYRFFCPTPLIYRATDNLPLGRSEKLNLYYNYKKESHHPTDVTAFFVSSLRNNLSMFLIQKTENSWKISRKSTITESYFSNVAGASLLKSHSLMNTFLRIHKVFINNFLMAYFQHTTSLVYFSKFWFKGSRTIASEENCPPTPKLTLSQILSLTGGNFPSWPKPKP